MAEPLDNQNWRQDAISMFIPFCEKQIKSHNKNIHTLKMLTWFEILVGVALTVLAFVIFRTDMVRLSETFFKLGPMFMVAPFPAFQYKMILGSQQSLSSYLIWKDRFQSALDSNVPPPEGLVNVVIQNMGEVTKPR